MEKIRWTENFTGKYPHMHRKIIPDYLRLFAEVPCLTTSIWQKNCRNLKQCIVTLPIIAMLAQLFEHLPFLQNLQLLQHNDGDYSYEYIWQENQMSFYVNQSINLLLVRKFCEIESRV